MENTENITPPLKASMQGLIWNAVSSTDPHFPQRIEQNQRQSMRMTSRYGKIQQIGATKYSKLREKPLYKVHRKTCQS